VKNRVLKPGDVVEVRPPGEILATLDASGARDGVIFMPEMLQYVGRRFTVSKRVEKICDLISPGGGSRRTFGTVLLDDLRCDGSAHAGCQAACKIFWKEEWLVPVPAGPATPAAAVVPSARNPAFIPLETLARSTVRPAPSADPAGDHYRCQATDAIVGTGPLKVTDPGQYVRELTSRNVTLRRFLRVAVHAIWGSIGHRLKLKGSLPMKLGGKNAVRGEKLGLQPGEWVQVKSAEEIGLTLNESGLNRGLAFTSEMVPSCGKVYQVKARVRTIVDEKTGKLLTFKNECIMLEGAVCTGDNVPGRWFCPRDGYPFWREDWLRRVDPPAGLDGPPARAIVDVSNTVDAAPSGRR